MTHDRAIQLGQLIAEHGYRVEVSLTPATNEDLPVWHRPADATVLVPIRTDDDRLSLEAIRELNELLAGVGACGVFATAGVVVLDR